MGKGGGCVPSKKRSPIGESDHDLPNPVQDGPIPQNPSPDSTIPVQDGSIPIEGQNPGPVSTIPVQDGALQTVVKKLRVFIVFYSMYGHVEGLARRMKKGVDGIDGVEGVLYRVPETLAPEVLDQMKVPSKEGEVPVISPEELVAADGLLFGFPTRYGCMSAQMKAFFDSTGELWKEQKLAGVPAGFFVSTGTQGGGQETTAWTAITQLAHHGMLFVPIGYTFGAGMFKMDSIRGGSPYGAGVFSGDGTREPSEMELALAEHQGKYMAMVVKRFAQPYSVTPNHSS
ncbi:NAD(P)H dehydrogenaseFQR1-like [Actinidia chinensis var. chinensis]|uniref:NAD(P)H dehydrogenase (quinone) n=1 Tax=Actinidia chinensis var. chinensis TaxID=1590841 RepID=A0A2R6RBW7_ACTCC|nr:NAD(P)H dehydrogenaseFQR1-like [Actinidia chinensis var. chinensis]